MRKNLFISSLCIASTVLTVGCSSSDSDDNTGLLALALLANRSAGSVVAITPKNLPTKATIDAPKSVSAGSNTQSLIRQSGPEGSQQAFGYMVIKESVSQMRYVSVYGTMEMLLLDGVFTTFKESGTKTQNCVAPKNDDTGFITFDARYIAAIRATLVAQGLTEEQINQEMQMWNSFNGVKIAIPAYEFKELENDPKGYKYEIAYSYNVMEPAKRKACPGQNGSHDFIVRINEDLTELSYGGKFEIDLSSMGPGTDDPSFEGGETPPPPPTSIKQTAPGGDQKIKISFNMTTTNKTDAISMRYRDTVSIGTSTFKSNMNVEACNPATFQADKCWQANMIYSGNMGDGLGDLRIRFNGKMDNAGGLIQSSFKMGSQPADILREQFDGQGNITGLVQCNDAQCSNPQVLSGSLNEASYSGFNEEPSIVANAPTVTADFGGSTLNEGDFFVITLTNVNPAIDPASVIGIIARIDGKTEVEYWGPTAGSSVGDSKVWKMDGFNETTGEPTFTAITVTLSGPST